MTDQKKVAGQPLVESPAPDAEPKSLDRRAILGLLGVGALLGQACGKGAFSSGSKSGKKIDNAGGTSGKADGDDGKAGTAGKDKSGAKGGDAPDGNDAPDGGPDSNGGPEGQGDVNLEGGNDTNADGNDTVDGDVDETSCHANDNGGKIDASNIPEMPDAMKPAVKFYGRDASAMVALKFGDGAAEVKQVILAKEDGKLQALHGISGADKKDGKFRVIVVDNINLAGSAKLLIVVQSGDKRFKTLITKEYFTKKDGKDVIDLSPMTVPAAWAANQSVTQFSETVGSFNNDTNVSYPGPAPGTVRNLQTVKAGTTWTKSGGVKGTVTDLMGDTIDIGGGALIEHNMFCTYLDVGGKLFRTMLQVG